MSFISQPQASGSASVSVSASGSSPRLITKDREGNGNPPTPLRPITSKSGFTFPAIWSFPPFFTLQPNPATLAQQVTLWTSLILNWAQHQRVFEVNCDAVHGGGEVFSNRLINRRLLPPSMRVVMNALVKDGHAIPDPPKQTTTFLLYWRKPEEWGSLIYDWVTENGLNSSIMTFYEITDGDLSDRTEFYQLPTSLLKKALDTLVKRGKAQIFRGEGEAGEGVRFL